MALPLWATGSSNSAMTQASPDMVPADVVPAAMMESEGIASAKPIRAVPHAAETRRLYAADWGAFARWCREWRLTALPATPATVAAYLGSMALTLSHGALARRAAAIAGQHRQTGQSSPTTALDVQSVLKAARAAKRANGAAAATSLGVASQAPARRKPPPSSAQLTRTAACCSGDLAGLRDRALLLLAAAGLDGERLLALDFEHVRLTGHGVDLTVRSSDGVGQNRLSITRVTASAACPVWALERWLDSSDTRFGPVFRKVNRWGAVEHRRLRPDGLRRIWRQRRAKAMRTSRAGGPAGGSGARARRPTGQGKFAMVSAAEVPGTATQDGPPRNLPTSDDAEAIPGTA